MRAASALLLLALLGSCFAADKIAVDFYFEALCPGCMSLYNNCLYQYMQHEDLMNVSKMEVYPFGNGRIVTRDPPTFTCQHGTEECYLNTVETCVVKKYPLKQWSEFLLCLEKSSDKRGSIQRCAKTADVDYKNLMECTEGPEGQQLLLEVADATPKDHKYVPWITIDSEHVKENDVVEEVCSRIKGTKPPSCATFSCNGAEFTGRSRNMEVPKDAKKHFRGRLGGKHHFGKHHFGKHGPKED